ncbi:tRNA 2-selenouridine(34) synthase MnmH [Frigidibacter sp. MR17.14]|uniref:tRNA 2-selenouridine(34) synthase MnmH n=1 Tax=Frigidibacter sp. MR17.14 TaxID=3126509 RepID=UPI0030131A1B
MPVTLTSLAQIAALGFDDIIDVRAPAEYAEDHIPGALSLPVLDDEERARVGTVYKQVSPFDARKIGAALVAKNASAHIAGPLADRTGGWRPLVYCWRGGQRSGSFATILSQIGWRVDTIAGGYKAFRRLVVETLYDRPFPAPVIVLDGNTGSAKTELLNRLPGHCLQVIDLEGLANHRGSLFGAMGPQPAQKGFETRLAMAIAALDPTRPVVIEAESAKVGDCRLPPALWHALCAAPRIEIAAPLPERAAYLARAYADVSADPARLSDTLDRLRPLQPAETVDRWQALAAAGDLLPLAAELMERHYDPRYSRHRARVAVPVTPFATDSLAPEALAPLAARLAALVTEGAAP